LKNLSECGIIKMKAGDKMNSILINFNKKMDINKVYDQLKKLYPDTDIIKYNDEFGDLLLASESSLDFWNNDVDDEVWNNA